MDFNTEMLFLALLRNGTKPRLETGYCQSVSHRAPVFDSTYPVVVRKYLICFYLFFFALLGAAFLIRETAFFKSTSLSKPTTAAYLRPTRVEVRMLAKSSHFRRLAQYNQLVEDKRPFSVYCRSSSIRHCAAPILFNDLRININASVTKTPRSLPLPKNRTLTEKSWTLSISLPPAALSCIRRSVTARLLIDIDLVGFSFFVFYSEMRSGRVSITLYLQS